MKSQRGFSFIEVLIGMVVLVLLAVAFLGAVNTTVMASNEANVRTTAESLADGQMETIKASGYAVAQAGTMSGNGPDWGPNPNPPPTDYGLRPGGAPTVWPTSTELTDYYMAEVNSGAATYIPGGWSPSGTITLNQTTYVAGNFNMTSGTTLNLNGHTLFVDGSVLIKKTDVNPPGTNAPGAIIATGDVTFMPNLDTGASNNGVFILTLGSAGAYFQPGGNFYGWIAAQNGVELKSGSGPSYNWVNPATLTNGLDFPGLNGVGGPGLPAGYVKISTWKIGY